MAWVGGQLGRCRPPGREMRFSRKDPMDREAAAMAGWFGSGPMARLPIVAGRGMRISCKDPMQQRMGLPDGDGPGSGPAARTAAAGLEMRISCSDPMQQSAGRRGGDGWRPVRVARLAAGVGHRMRIRAATPCNSLRAGGARGEGSRTDRGAGRESMGRARPAAVKLVSPCHCGRPDDA